MDTNYLAKGRCGYVRDARVESVLLLFKAVFVREHVMSLRLLPQVIKLNKFAHRPRLHLLTTATHIRTAQHHSVAIKPTVFFNLVLLNREEILSVRLQPHLELAALFFRPHRHRV